MADRKVAIRQSKCGQLAVFKEAFGRVSVQRVGGGGMGGYARPFLYVKRVQRFQPVIQVWKNHADWHLDHVRPCSKFDLLNSEQVTLCNNWRNFQPLVQRRVSKKEMIMILTLN